MISLHDLLTDKTASAAKPAARARVDVSMWLLIVLCVFAGAVGRLCYIVRPFDSDGSMFIYMGRLISEGGRFGHDIVDNKFPTVGLITSVPWRAFGAHWASYVLLGGAVSLLSCALLARIARRNFGEHATLPALLFGLVYFNFNFAVFGGFQLETIQSLFTILAAGAALEWLRDRDWRDALLIGLASGCATMCKPTGVAVLGAIGVIALMVAPRDLLRHAAAIAAGFLVVAMVVIIYLIRSDTLHEMPALWRQISLYAANSSWDPADWTKPLTILVLAGFPIVVRGWVFRRPNDRLRIDLDRAAIVFVIVWLILESIGVAAQRRMYAYHFLVLVPPVALLFAMLPRRVRVAPLAMALVPTALFSIYGASLVFEICYTGERKSPVGEYVEARTHPNDSVWKDDAAKLWLETGRRPATRFPITFLFANHDDAPTEFVGQMLSDFDRTRPTYIVLPAQRERMVAHQSKYILELSRFPRRRENFGNAWQRIFDYVDRDYVWEARIGNDAIYRRRDADPSPRTRGEG